MRNGVCADWPEIRLLFFFFFLEVHIYHLRNPRFGVERCVLDVR